ncbi:rna-directed dna polymerase from mobile element jockey-like [Willisornis vidua]|uniref:Rna-directed dna polymerase from mobile element jockey-like n=1 Tax=Willisornis vidua TaxID=1566151 RepID=A0ABQ9CX08_9PASS|nr:rna-directed dna polymerase from mobile element jockey-like [Willisornis vidua]
MSKWKLVHWCPSASVLGPLCFRIFINDMSSEIKCTLSNCADDRKLYGAVDTTEGRDVIQGDLDKLEKWAHEHLIEISKSNCNVLYWVGQIPDMSTDWEKSLRETLQKRTWGVFVHERLDMN